MNDREERELIRGCVNDDRKSQASIYKKYYGYAMAICLRYSDNREEAKEILNDAFLSAFLSLKGGVEVRSFKFWLRRIIINTAIDKFRKSKKIVNTIELSIAEDTKNNYSILDTLSEKEIITFIQRLSPMYKLVFNLFVIEGFSHREISDQLGISISTSKANLTRAKARLRKLLPQLDPERFTNYG